MAIKDIIVPAFVGSATIKFIVTRGFIAGAPPAGATASGLQFEVPSHRFQFEVPKDQFQGEVPE